MHVIGVDAWAPRPGVVLQWLVRSDAEPVPSTVPPSFNQSAHLADVDDGSTWLAASFDVPGPLDTDALERSLERLVARHGSLRTGFVRSDAGPSRVNHPQGALTLRRRPDIAVPSVPEAHRVVRAALDAACAPFSAPAYTFLAIDRPDVSTVVCGFDHAHVDAYSLAVVIDDVRRGYLGEPETAPDPGDFVDYCAAESAGTPIDLADDRLRTWVDFLHAGAGAPPQFPLDLGVPHGRTDRCAVRVDTLLTAREADAAETGCRADGASLYAGVLAAMAHAVRDLGGAATVPLLFPLHTRRSAAWRSSVGWFVTNAPLEVVTESDLRATIRSTGPAVRRAVALGEVPIARVVEAAGGLRRPRKDVFMVSYVDYRSAPGHDLLRSIDAHHISNVTVSDDAQFWISRTADGLALRSRFPDNPTARTTIEAFVAAVTDHLALVAQPCEAALRFAVDTRTAADAPVTVP